jgi:hypothetical protein
METTMSKLETPPAYVYATPEQWDAAKRLHETKKLNTYFHMGAGHRRSALRATMNCGNVIALHLAVEFRDVIDNEKYAPVKRNNSFEVEQKEKARVTMRDYQETIRKRAIEQPRSFKTTAEARAIMSPVEWTHWSVSPEGQMVARLELAGHDLSARNG